MNTFINIVEFMTQKLPTFVSDIWNWLNIPIELQVLTQHFTINPLEIFSIGGLATIIAIWCIRGS